jgi:DNA-binding transcriptional ArsR family regulator
LARSLEKRRPSVSRSLKTLEEGSLVKKDRKGWILTDEGREEAERVSVRLAETVSSAKEIVVRTLGIDQLRTIDLPQMSLGLTGDLTRILAGNWSRDLKELMTMASIERFPNADLLKSLGAISQSAGVISQISKSAMDMLRPSLTAVLEVQGAYTNLFRQFSEPGAFSLDVQNLVAGSSILTNEALQNIGAVGLAASSLGVQLDQLFYPGVAGHLRDVGDSYRAFTASAISHLELSPPPVSLVQRDIAVPSLTFASYTRSLRSAAPSRTEEDSSLVSSYGEEGVGRELDVLLGRLKVEFVRMRRGGWEALRSGNPDRFRHAAVSHRELISHVLRETSPDAPIEEGKPGSRLKNQVKNLLAESGTSAELAVSLSTAVFSLYKYLSKVTHADVRDEQAVRAALLTGDGLLLFLLSHRSP